MFFELPDVLMKKSWMEAGDDLKWEETENGVLCRKVKYQTLNLNLTKKIM